MERIDRILAGLPLKGPGPLQQRQIEEVLVDLLGEDIAHDVRVGSIRGGRVNLEAASAARAFELDVFHKDPLLRAIQAISGLESLKELRVRVGS